MELKLHNSDRVRISTRQEKVFIDVSGLPYEQGIKVEFIPSYVYMEVREKQGQVATFYFAKKSDKKDFDFQWWENAEVVYSKNNVRHN